MKKDIKSNIVNHLIKKGCYESDVDDMVIDILVDNLKFLSRLAQKVEEEGLVVTILNGNGISTTRENPSYGTYTKCLDNIHQCCAKLGISRKDRISLKIMEEKMNDGFDELTNS
jgi:P27 family predicted phage terminase small subunit